MAWFWKRKPSSEEPAQQTHTPPSLPASLDALGSSPAKATNTPLPSTGALRPTPLTSAEPQSSSSESSFFSQRHRRQLGLFLGGWAFFALSLRVTRRAVIRRYRSLQPTYFQSNTRPAPILNGPLEALEALYVATLNVAAFSMIMVGGTMWAFDIEGMDDLRTRVRSRLYRDDTNGDAAQATPGRIEGDSIVTLLQQEEESRLQNQRPKSGQNSGQHGGPR